MSTTDLGSQQNIPTFESLDSLRDDVRRWREWAQFVFLGGGPLSGDDKALQAAVCAKYDADVAEAGARPAAPRTPEPKHETRSPDGDGQRATGHVGWGSTGGTSTSDPKGNDAGTTGIGVRTSAGHRIIADRNVKQPAGSEPAESHSTPARATGDLAQRLKELADDLVQQFGETDEVALLREAADAVKDR